MLCETPKHRPDCICQELKSIYGRSIYKCGRPGCPSYRVGFDTKSMRDGHTQRHDRPFKCRHSECPFATLGFAKETGLKSHLAQAHNRFLHIESEVTPTETNATSEEELEAILIDAVQENDLSTIRSEVDAVRKFILVLLLRAYQGRSSDSMIKHLLGEIPPDLFSEPEKVHSLEIYANILKASTKHGNYEVFYMPSFKLWMDTSGWTNFVYRTLTSIGRTRSPDVLETAVSNSYEVKDSYVRWRVESLVEGVIPLLPDTPAEIRALECLERIKHQLSKALYDRLLLKVAGRCCSIEIAEFSLAGGASIKVSIGGSTPLLAAAKQTSLEAAKFMEFLMRKGATTADSAVRFRGKALSELPGPKNIHNWMGITWEELVKQNTLSVEASPGHKANVT